MGKYKCEYISENTSKKEIAMIKEPDEVLDIIQRADCSKEIKIFEKQNKWQLVYHVKGGKTQLNNIFKNAKKIYKPQYKYDSVQPEDFSKGIMNAFNACSSRIENQNFLEVLFDSVFKKEDVSKPKLNVLKGVKKD
ncbi:hypothetical protein [Clostridium sporogenes]|uniref:hypothetical protein n=1 Tax=Clostridium sporogenes TaxID=1509 RepID=UPI0006B281ED|nr:hypothetical protein [Clostridium sporogenes]KOY66111.1 hypothetical protein AN649_09875 [Clostridium sporogenes]MDS1006464.1 hypothetical protein [Clostridium sporogenes]